MSSIRNFIAELFTRVISKRKLIHCVKVEGSTDDWNDEWYIRVHLPVRTSPHGAPLLLLSAVDVRQADRMISRGHLNKERFSNDCARIFGDRNDMSDVPFFTARQARVLRSVLRLNSTKIQPTKWQMENVPLMEDPMCSWLVTFIQPLYQDYSLCQSSHETHGGCGKCHKKADNLKLCGRCRAVLYCCAECQRSDWPKHKISCSTKM